MVKNKNQKNLLLLMVVIMIVFAINNFLVAPKRELLESKIQELDQKNQENNQIMEEIAQDHTIEELLNYARSRILILGNALPSQINQEEIIKYQSKMIDDYKLNGKNFTYRWALAKYENNGMLPLKDVLDAFQSYAEGDPTALENIQPFSSGEGDEAGSKINPMNQLGELTLNVSFNGTYVDLKEFLSAIETGKYTAFIKRISLSKVPTTMSDVTGQLEISFPYYYDGESLKELEWELIEDEYGRYDPFLEKVRSQVVDEKQALKDPTTVDFLMFLESFVSDGPTIGVQKKDMRQSALYVDADDKLPLEIWIQKDENGYQYRYQLNTLSYPADGGWVPFDPLEDNVVMKVTSSPRGPEDLAGCHVIVHNMTDTLLEIHSYYDDENLPRLEVTSQEGKFVLYRH